MSILFDGDPKPAGENEMELGTANIFKSHEKEQNWNKISDESVNIPSLCQVSKHESIVEYIQSCKRFISTKLGKGRLCYFFNLFFKWMNKKNCKLYMFC